MSFVWSDQTQANTQAWKMREDTALSVFLFFFFTHSTQDRSCSFTFTQDCKPNKPHYLSSMQALIFSRLHEVYGTFLGNVCSLMRSVHLSALPAANDKHSMTATTGPVLSAFPCRPPFAVSHCTGKIQGQFISESKCGSLTMGWLLWGTTEWRERMWDRWRKRKGERGRWDWVRGRWKRFHSDAVLQCLFSPFLSSFITT